MANTFTIKRGSDIPTKEVLANYELGYSTNYKTLYIRHDDDVLPIGPLHPELLYGGTEIPEAADLNTYTELGNYFSPNGDRSATLINTEGQAPFTSSGFALKVKTVYGSFENVTVIQEAYNYTGEKKYRHGEYSSVTQTYSWSVWKTYLNNESKFFLSSSQVTGTLQLANGGTGTVFTDIPVNAIIKASEDSSQKKLSYTTIKSGAFYATAENGVPTFGILPIPQGGTGLTTNPSMLVNLASTSAANVLQASPRPGVTGQLPLINGGTGTSFTDITPFAIIRNTNNTDNLWFTPTANGAFYATGDNTLAQFGILPIDQGGTGATTAAAARTNLGFVMGSSTAYSSASGTAVTFKDENGNDIEFSTTPKVFATYSKTGSNVTGDYGSLKIFNITKKGFTATIGGSSDGERNYDWIAIGNLA